jgi:hypothetical protein
MKVASSTYSALPYALDNQQKYKKIYATSFGLD